MFYGANQGVNWIFFEKQVVNQISNNTVNLKNRRIWFRSLILFYCEVVKLWNLSIQTKILLYTYDFLSEWPFESIFVLK